MLFTREPVIESVVASKEGYHLVLHTTKAGRSSELTCEAVEIVTFGNTTFFRSQEKSKPFLVPAADYEISEVKDQRGALKLVPQDRAMKASGGKDSGPKEAPKEAPAAKERTPRPSKSEPAASTDSAESAADRKRRRRRRRGGRDKGDELVAHSAEEGTEHDELVELHEMARAVTGEALPAGSPDTPSQLIEETLTKYREGGAPAAINEAENSSVPVFFFDEAQDKTLDPGANSIE